MSARAIAAICLAGACLAAAPAAAPAAALPAWAPIAHSGPTNLPPAQSEVQRLAVDAAADTYTLSFEGDESVPIDFDDEAAQVEAELNGLASIEAQGSVTVSGGPGGPKATHPYFVAFDGGALKETDVPELVVDDSGLAGGDNGAASITTAVGGGPGTTTIAFYAQNVGGAPSAGPVTLSFTLPEGVRTTATPSGGDPFEGFWSCGPTGAGQSEVSCTSPPGRVAGPGFTMTPLKAPVAAAPGAVGGAVSFEVSGGGATGAAAAQMPLAISAIASPPGLQSFGAAAYREDGTVDERAGAHPYSASAGILINTVRSPRTGQVFPAGEFRDIVVETPPGFFGNPTATEQCPEAVEQEDCPLASIVATAQVPLEGFGAVGELASVNNIEAPFGHPAKFRFGVAGGLVIINVAASLRSDEDYGLEVGSYNTPQLKPVFGSFFTFWGAPADTGHDDQRCSNLLDPRTCGEGGDNVAFLSSPVDCAEERRRAPVARINVNTWQNPGLLFSAAVPLEPVEGCEELDFDAEFAFEPTSAKAADSPASFRTELAVPGKGQTDKGLTEPDKRMNPTIRESVVELPEGVVLNAAAAAGLEACSEAQIGLKGTDLPRPNEIRFSKAPDSCPDAAKIGSGELNSELIEEPLRAELFLAAQGEGNPFGSLFAIYLVIEDPRNGIFIKLPGEVRVNEQTGKQRIVFRDLPPLPFSTLKLNLKGGARSPLATPTTCGNYATNATNTPWSAPESGPPLSSSSAFSIDRGPGGGACANTLAERPFAPGFRAGSDSVQAGAFSPLRFQVTRPDGDQELDTLRFANAPGLAASLKGVPYCPEAAIALAAAREGRAEQAAPACPAASRIGRSLAGAGSGPRPFYAPGELYLAGPYRGAPLSIAAITPAVAGPFDLGTVVVRSAIFVNPRTAQVSAQTDPLPQILAGVPLRVRDVRVILDRPGFSLNPTGCEAKQIGLGASGASGAVAELADRFQVGNCRALAFKPKLRLRLFGGIRRGKYQGLRAVVRPRPGDANIGRTVVRMPRSAFLAQEHIRTVCTRLQFAADACPKGAVYGRAIAYSPLLDFPLKGNVYLRSSENELPDLVADLRGPPHQPIKVELVGRTDSVKGALRNTFDVVPDAPVSYFRLQLFGGKKGLIVNSRNICKGKNRAGVRLDGHNGRRQIARPVLRNGRCAKLRRKRR